MPLVFLSIIGLAIITMWILGEVYDSRPLRLGAICLPILWIGPFAYQIGLIFGHGRAYERCRTEACSLVDAVTDALDEGRTEQVIFRLKKLRAANDGVAKHAGTFFFPDMASAAQDISSPPLSP